MAAFFAKCKCKKLNMSKKIITLKNKRAVTSEWVVDHPNITNSRRQDGQGNSTFNQKINKHMKVHYDDTNMII